MKRFYLLFFLVSISLHSVGQIGFQNAFGDTTPDFGQAIIKSSQGFYCLVGSTRFSTGDSTEISIYFIDAFGDLITSSTVGLPGHDYPTSVTEASDGNFIITGYTYGSPLDPVFSDIFAIKVDNVDGFEVWSHFYGGQDEDRANCIVATPDGNYLIGGSTKSYGPFNQSALAMKIDDSGNLIWSKITGIGIETDYYSAVISTDSNYVLCGTALDGNGSDHYITKMQSDGTILWTSQIGTNNDEVSGGLAVTADSGYVISGSYYDQTVSNEDMLLTKLDSAGNVQWAKSYSTSRDERLYSVLQNSEGNFVATGYSNTDTTGVIINHLAVLETSDAGNQIWSNVYGYISEVTEGYSVIQSIDDGYAFAGTTYATGDPLGEAFFLKTDTAGVSGCDELIYPFLETSLTMNAINAGFEDPVTPDTITYTINSNSFTSQYVQMCFWDNVNNVENAFNIKLYPNPASETVTVEGDFSNGTIQVYDQLGQAVYETAFSGNKIQLNTSALLPGIYFIRIINGKTNTTLKFIRL